MKRKPLISCFKVAPFLKDTIKMREWTKAKGMYTQSLQKVVFKYSIMTNCKYSNRGEIRLNLQGLNFSHTCNFRAVRNIWKMLKILPSPMEQFPI